VDAPRPATEASVPDLEELLLWVRRELVLRDEAPSGTWVEESARDLKVGRKPGWYLPPAGGGGLAFYQPRGAQAYGHVHVGVGPDARGRAHRLADRLLDTLPPEIRSIDVGFTGLAADGERELLEAMAVRPGSTLIARRAMERALAAGDGAPLAPLPGGLVYLPVRRVTLDALADLDLRAFSGSTDALLAGPTVADYRRVLESVLGGQFGRFLDEASTAVYRAEPPQLVGALLTTELSARRAVFVDFMVDPASRRQGLGRGLLRWGLRALWALGYERVRLWVTDANTAARTLYETSGFRVTATASIYRWDRPVPK